VIPANIFDAVHYLNVRKPLLEASTLPNWCYTSDEFYQREVKQLFLRMWNFAGREDEIPEPGDYLVFDICNESVILIRGKDQVIRAFANTCRHRGAQLLHGSGNCRSIVCPYHSWVYGLDGKLERMRGMEDTLEFDPAEYGLILLKIDTWAGFIFISFSEECGELNEFLGDLPEQFASYKFSDVVCVRRKEYIVNCNWKLYLENAMEDYHTPTVHMGSIGGQDTVPIQTTGEWDAIHMESESSVAVLPEDESTLPHIEVLRDLPANGTFFTAIYPSTFFATTQDCMWWLQSLPQGPQKTKVIQGSCFPKTTVARDDFKREVNKYYDRWDKSIPEDNAIVEQQQLGLNSVVSRPGRLSSREPIVHSIANWVLDHTISV